MGSTLHLSNVELAVLRQQAARDPRQLNGPQKNALIQAAIRERAESSPARKDSATAPAGPVRVTEASIINSYDPDDALGPSGGGTRYMRSITGDKMKLVERKELPPHVREKVLKVAAQLWDGSPLARRFIVRLVNYLVGDGISVQAKHDDPATKKKIQATLDAFWNDSRNRLDRRIGRWIMSYEAYGELCLVSTVNPTTGLVRLAFVSPARILDVKSEDGDIEHLIQVWLRAGVSGSETNPDKREIVRPDESDPTAGKKSYGRLKGEAFYWGANRLPDMVRGRPSQLVVADFLDADDQLIWNLLERTAFGNAFIWDVTMEGADADKIQEWRRDNGAPPRPGSVQVHNEKVKYEAKSVDLKSMDSVTQHDLLVGVVALSHGMPAMWFTANSDPNRANGENLTGPTLKDMTAKQREIREIVADLAAFQVDQAIIAGVLPDSIPNAYDAFTVEMPDLSVSDTSAGATALGAVIAAMVMAMQQGLATRELAVRCLAMILNQMGLEVDPAKLLEEAVKEKEEADKKAAAAADPYASQKGQGGQALPPPMGQDKAPRLPAPGQGETPRPGQADGSERKPGGR